MNKQLVLKKPLHERMMRGWWPFVLICFSIFQIWIASFLIWYSFFGPVEKNIDLGTFGDSFGGINALFSGLAFAGVIYSILLQSAELRLQREELKLTREEMKMQKVEMAKQVKEFEQQNENLKSQRLEDTFFKLLEIHGKNRSQLVNYVHDNEDMGLGNGISQLFKELEEQYDRNKRGGDYAPHLSKIVHGDIQHNALGSDYLFFVYFFNQKQNLFGHYFRNLYHIYKYIKERIHDDAAKELYARIVRAQLSSHEQIFIFYNCLVPGLGYKEFLELGFEFKIFHNMNYSLIFEQSHFTHYENLESEYLRKNRYPYATTQTHRD